MSRKIDVLQLPALAGFRDLTLFALRAVTGAFLIHEVWDNIVSAERMTEFVDFMASFGFQQPQFWAPVSVWVQFACGILLVLGLFTRWAGILVAINFIVAVAMVHWNEDFRGWWPALILILLGAHFAAAGSGRLGLDALIRGRRLRPS